MTCSFDREPSDLDFLFRLKHLIHLGMNWPIHSETVREAFEELPVLSSLHIKLLSNYLIYEIDHSKQFRVSFGSYLKATFSDLNAAIEFVFGNERPRKRKAKDLE